MILCNSGPARSEVFQETDSRSVRGNVIKQINDHTVKEIYMKSKWAFSR